MKPGVSGHVERWRGRARDLTDRALTLPGASVILRIVRELATASLSDRSMTLSAQAFTSCCRSSSCSPPCRSAAPISTKPEQPGRQPHSTRRVPVDVDDHRIRCHRRTDDDRRCDVAGPCLGRMYMQTFRVNRLSWRGWWRWVVVIFLIPVAVMVQGLITRSATSASSESTTTASGRSVWRSWSSPPS